MIALSDLPWRWIGAGLGVAAVALWIVLLKADARHWQKVADNRAAQIARLKADVRLRTAEAQAADAARVIAIERARAEVSNEVSNDYQADIAALRARYDRLLAQARTDSGGGGRAPVSGVSDTAGGPDGDAPEAGLSAADALIASEQALQLQALQRWVREQQGVE